MVDILEPPFLQLAERVTERIVTQPEVIREKAHQIRTYEIPYRFIGLPPNLYDHLDPSQPFLPDTKEGILDLVNGFQIYNERFKRLRAWDQIQIGKEEFYRDLAYELRRRQLEENRVFSTAAERDAWQRYNLLFRGSVWAEGNRPTFHQNVEFVNYLNNRNFSEESGFFEKTDGVFDYCLLADFSGTRNAFASQVRVPFNAGRTQAAQELLMGTHILMSLITDDELLREDTSRFWKEDQEFILAHLTRARGLEVGSMSMRHEVSRAIHGTLLESMATISSSFAVCEADGIPGFEDDDWEGLSAMLEADIPVRLATRAAVAAFPPATLHGNYFKQLLEVRKGKLGIRPDVETRMQEMSDRQTIQIHAAWQAYYDTLELAKRDRSIVVPSPPVRFGLHCPFKAAVVRSFAETLITCRAAVHGMAA